MVEWHRRKSARVGLRVAGLFLLGCFWLLRNWLIDLVGAHPQGVTIVEFAVGLLLFSCFSAGLALTAVGHHLFDQVAVSARWVKRRVPYGEQDQPHRHV